MVHPDYQYDPTLVPKIIEPITRGDATWCLARAPQGRARPIAAGDAVVEIRGRTAFLTWVENRAFGLSMSEYHTGYRAFSREEPWKRVNFRMNSDGFVFDQEIVSQDGGGGFRIAEIAVPVRYFPEALLRVLRGLLRLRDQDSLGGHPLPAASLGLKRSRRLESIRRRYTRLGPDTEGAGSS
jgi:hypothetical protein